MSNITTSRRAIRITEVTFDPRLKTYTFWGTTMLFVITIVGIAILPFWLIFGKIYVNRYYDNLFCELTTRALHFKKGIWFQTERTIPLDKIQDLTFKEGPLLRYFGLSYLKIETAGQSVQGMADMTLTGIVNARNFREMVLDQRDLITDKQLPAPSTPGMSNDDDMISLLKQIHEILQKIEQKTG
jgi:membrane protein YdbS with pleckstrin-like domain